MDHIIDILFCTLISTLIIPENKFRWFGQLWQLVKAIHLDVFSSVGKCIHQRSSMKLWDHQ